ncbi:AAA family ATPase [Aurantiacibacter rhizosphaerae]|uniref:AAA domain-containing protein n=1 Tax=Aurantiacibacter rhizosphaerae TaxID=2691582 RepID=A0A844XED6_9SPHN|nr:hypothetical protein [Aurantiacibacter rhizosphaerae]MWV28941.1 hypothetical protein [Aurantiacibacter rhizosphaerae]
MKDILNLSATKAVGKAPRTTIIASPMWVDGAAPVSSALVRDLKIHALGPEEEVSREELRDCELLIVEVDANYHASLDRLAAIKRMRPDLAIMAAVQNADMPLMRTLLRHGVSDAVALPFDSEELTSEIINIGARLAENTQVPLAPSVSFVGALGRSGTTAIMVHLANALVARSEHPIRCCLIDLDLQSGHLAGHTNVDTNRSILGLLDAEERVDQDMIRNVATKSKDGIYVIPSPPEILPIEQVDTDQLLRIVELARAEFDLVFIDLPSAWTSWSLSVAAESDSTIMVVRQDLDHLRQAKRCFGLFREVGIPNNKVKVIVNRATKGMFKSISLQDVADTVGFEVMAAIREDRGELSHAIDEGKLVTAISRRNVFAQDIDAIAARFEQATGDGGR